VWYLLPLETHSSCVNVLQLNAHPQGLGSICGTWGTRHLSQKPFQGWEVARPQVDPPEGRKFQSGFWWTETVPEPHIWTGCDGSVLATAVGWYHSRDPVSSFLFLVPLLPSVPLHGSSNQGGRKRGRQRDRKGCVLETSPGRGSRITPGQDSESGREA
jgi:hypothetical protein